MPIQKPMEIMESATRFDLIQRCSKTNQAVPNDVREMTDAVEGRIVVEVRICKGRREGLPAMRTSRKSEGVQRT